ncbi:MAG: arylamine N-acetyltransferase [Anaerolineae bacterium]|nr:arylamine N-acetyltransferase [Anaerolineae bacterium]
MDVNAYLERIGYHGELEPTLDTLTALHRAHLMAIPYENLDIHLGSYLSLDEAAIFDKLVTRRRGGWCYEMNGLLAGVLRAMGYDVTLLSSDVRADFVGAGMSGDHLILLVKLDRPYLVDVGFGNGLLEPIPLEPGAYTQGFLTYRLLQDGDRWFFQNHPHGGAGFVFTLEPRTLPYFTRRCHELQTLPQSGFVRTTVCMRFTPDSLLTLRGAILQTITAHGATERVVDSEATYRQLLGSRFDLHLSDVAPLWQKVWERHQAWTRENAR